MNILYYLGSFPKLSASFVLNEIYELERSGHNVAVCARHRPDESVTHEEFDNLDIPITYIKNILYSNVIEGISTKFLRPRVFKNILYWESPQHHVGNLFWAKQCIEFVEELEWDIDHIHTHFAGMSKFGARYVASFYNVPFTITAHGADLYKEPVGDYTSTLLQSADRIVTISDYNKQYIQEHFVKETPIDIVRAGIRPEKFSPTDSAVEKRILTVSRFVEKKGLKYALEAIAGIAEQVPDIEYHIVGSGELEEDLLRKVTELDIEENVTFLDNVDDQRLLTEFDEARCFLLPCVIAESGDRDGIPVVLMEAMAMRTPPVSTTVSGIPELIDHEKNGLLVNPQDPETTADAVLRLLQNDSEWATYHNHTREKIVDQFNIIKEAKKLAMTFKAAGTPTEQERNDHVIP